MTTKKLVAACKCGNLILAKKIYYKRELYNNILKLNIFTDSVLNKICKGGHTDIVIWLNEVCDIDFNENQFMHACIHGRIKLAQWLSNNINIIEYDTAFILSCEYGNINTAKWLISKLIYNKSQIIREAFKRACNCNHINIAIWLYNLDINLISFNDKDKALLYACANNNIKIAEWLQQIGANIHIEENKTFIVACEHGNIEIVKWLYNLGVNIDKEKIFLQLCIFSQIELMDWLIQLESKLHIKIINRAYINAWKYKNVKVIMWLHNHGASLSHFSWTHMPNNDLIAKIFQLNNLEKKLLSGVNNKSLDNIKEAIQEGVDYTMLNDFAFFRSCYFGNTEILEYLSNIEPRYYYEIIKINNFNKIINYEKKEICKNARNI